MINIGWIAKIPIEMYSTKIPVVDQNLNYSFTSYIHHIMQFTMEHWTAYAVKLSLLMNYQSRLSTLCLLLAASSCSCKQLRKCPLSSEHTLSICLCHETLNFIVQIPLSTHRTGLHSSIRVNIAKRAAVISLVLHCSLFGRWNLWQVVVIALYMPWENFTQLHFSHHSHLASLTRECILSFFVWIDVL